MTGKKQVEHRKFPGLRPGIRVQYVDRDGASRSERMCSRNGNTITVRNALNVKKRIFIEKVRGYWKPRVKASLENLIKLQF